MNIAEIGIGRHIRSIVSHTELADGLVAAVLRGLASTLGTRRKFRSPAGFAFQQYDSVVEQVSMLLVNEFGFRRFDNRCQVVLESSEFGFCLLMCKGQLRALQVLKVSKKGPRTEALVANNSPCISQLGLWNELMPTLPSRDEFRPNFWLTWEVTGPYDDEVVITLVLPIAINEAHTAFGCEETRILYRGPIQPVVALPAEVPQSVAVTPAVEEVEGNIERLQEQ